MSDYFVEYDTVLENKLGIDDPEILKQAEADIVFMRLAELAKEPVQGAFDFDHLKAIHFHLFSDLYPMAGKTRIVDIAKDGSVFCYAENIESMQKQIFGKLKRDHYLKGLSHREFAQKLAEFSGDLNALHPFREGNGRTIRCFLMQLANYAGYDLQIENADKVALLTADKAAFMGNTTPLAALYETLLHLAGSH